MVIPKKPQAQDVDKFIGGAKATRADRQQAPAAGAEKKMFSARLDPLTVRKIKVWAGLSEKNKEEIAQDAFDLYFKDKDVPV